MMKKWFHNHQIRMTREAPQPRITVEPVEVADSALARTVGLLGRDGPPIGGGMLIMRCRSIHTFFMRFTIDAAFVDEAYAIVDMTSTLPPGRFCVCRHRGGKHVLELEGGFLEKHGINIGDRWSVDPL